MAVGSRSLQGSAKATLQARWFLGAERVEIRARLRVVTNVFIGLGTVLAGVALLVDTGAAYRTTMVVVGLFTAAATVPLAGLRRVPGFAAGMDVHLDPDRVRGPSPLRDRTYVASVALNSVIAMQFSLTSVGVPLWIVTRTEAPAVVISLLLVLNTVLVALFQVRAARGTHDVLIAGRTVRRGSLLLAAACLLYAAAGDVGTVAAVVVLVGRRAARHLGGDLVRGRRLGAGLRARRPAAAPAPTRASPRPATRWPAMVAPALITATAVDHGWWGWVFLAVLFAAAGTAVGALAARAAHRRSVAVELVA